jgi:uncharacterized membrane protein
MPKDIFTSQQKESIVNSIKKAESNCSGEIRVHIERKCKGDDPIKRSKEIFEKLRMHETDLRNGVLFYISLDDHKFAIIGDKGINDVTPENFWDEIKSEMLVYLKQNNIVAALEKGIVMAGKALKEKFPLGRNDENELNDDISFGD